jgi:hypothetical protein
VLLKNKNKKKNIKIKREVSWFEVDKIKKIYKDSLQNIFNFFFKLICPCFNLIFRSKEFL